MLTFFKNPVKKLTAGKHATTFLTIRYNNRDFTTLESFIVRKGYGCDPRKWRDIQGHLNKSF